MRWKPCRRTARSAFVWSPMEPSTFASWSRTPARAFPASSRSASSTRFSPPNRGAQDWGSPSRGKSSRLITAGCTSKATVFRRRPLSSSFPPPPPSWPWSAPMSERILITEDDEDLAFVIREALTRQGYEADVAPTAGALLDKLKAGSYDLILLDVRLPDMDGLDAIPRCRDLAPETPIIVMTAHGTRQIAMNAITRGAYDFFTKPLKMSEFQVVVARALDRRRLQQQVKVLREGQVAGGFEELIGKSESLKRVTDMANRAAPTDLTVLIHGESGTGKELMARAIHRLSARKDGPFIPVNCAAIPEGLLESELFGHERGAFTGAIRARPGRFELAREGTLFLDR